MKSEEGIFMSKQEQFAYEMICRFQRGEVTRRDVANMLETTPRNISRISKRVKEKGMLGIKHGNTSRPPANKDSKSHKRMVVRPLGGNLGGVSP